MFPNDWLSIFASDAPILELVARSSALYLSILVLMRLFPRRTGGELATMDLILILLISEAVSGAFGESSSILDGVIMAATLITWNFAINVASFHFRAIERLVSAPPTQIIRDGKMLRRNMRREYVTEEELMSALHQEGIGNVDEVRAAFVEGEGKISVLKRG
jgi:uncharacterized membrane protein YcaP (DUF421 family)